MSSYLSSVSRTIRSWLPEMATGQEHSSDPLFEKITCAIVRSDDLKYEAAEKAWIDLRDDSSKG